MFKRQIEMFALDIIVAILKIEDTSSRYNSVEDLLHLDFVVKYLKRMK